MHQGVKEPNAAQTEQPVVPAPRAPSTQDVVGTVTPTARAGAPASRTGFRNRKTDQLPQPLAGFAPPQGAPLPRRPKGRFFVGLIVWLVIGGTVFAIWESFFHYAAHGVVRGRVLTVAAPWDGVVSTIHVREGDTFRQGDTLVSLQNVQLHQTLEQLHDQLRLAQAQLDAKVAALKYQTQLDDDRAKKANAELYELWGDVLRERATLLELRATKERYRKIPREGNLIPVMERERVDIAEQGQTEKVKKMIEALREMQARVDGHTESKSNLAEEPLGPEIVRIDGLQKEIAQMRTRIQQGNVRAPTDGRVVKRRHFIGEHVASADGILDALETGSEELVLYVTQRSLDTYEVGQAIQIQIDPLAELVACRVVRIGQELEAAPPAIAHHYRTNARLVPVTLEALNGDVTKHLRLGAEIKLPAQRGQVWQRWWQKTMARARGWTTPTPESPAAVTPTSLTTPSLSEGL